MNKEEYKPRLIDKIAEEHLEIFGAELYHYQDYNNKEIDVLNCLMMNGWLSK